MSRVGSWLLLAALALAACGRTAQPEGTPAAGSAGSAGSSSGSGGSSQGATAGSTSAGQPPVNCDEPAATSLPLTRLIGTEITRSWRDALGGLPIDELEYPETGSLLERANRATPAALVALLHEHAHDAALRFSQDDVALATLSGCDGATTEPACRDRFITRFLRRAFRRPATVEDEAEMAEVFATGVELGGGTFAAGARAVAEVALQSPELLYLVEEGEALDYVTSSLTPYELAARLSYFLTGGPPDEAMRERSEEASWDTAVMASEARRLLLEPATREQVRRVYAERYDFAWDYAHVPDAATAELLRAARVQADRFIDQVTFEGSGTFRSLLLDLDPLSSNSSRPGLFTQRALLFGSPRGEVAPVRRGYVVLDRLLCQSIPPPPEGINQSIPPPTPEASTTRERLELGTVEPACRSCHQLIDQVGFAFENFDALGEWRDEENGKPIDATGQLTVTDAQGKFNGAGELMSLIAESEDAKRCFVDQWLAQAYRRPLTEADACARQRLLDVFTTSDGFVPTLLVAIGQDEQLMYRARTP